MTNLKSEERIYVEFKAPPDSKLSFLCFSHQQSLNHKYKNKE